MDLGQPATGIRIGSANAADVGEAADILAEATAWASSHGFSSWQQGTFSSPDGWGRGRLEEALRAGGLFLAWDGPAAVATVSLVPEDRLFWRDAPPDALYLHRLAVRPSHMGLGIGAEIIRWAEEQVQRQGRRHLRLDCLRDNPGIRRYYDAAGFRHRGDVEIEGIGLSLYEKLVA